MQIFQEAVYDYVVRFPALITAAHQRKNAIIVFISLRSIVLYYVFYSIVCSCILFYCILCCILLYAVILYSIVLYPVAFYQIQKVS